MKFCRRFMILLLLFITAPTLFSKTFETQQEYMSLKEAQKRYGAALYTETKFKNGDSKDRSLMVVSLIKNKAFMGKPVAQVQQHLGESTAKSCSR